MDINDMDAAMAAVEAEMEQLEMEKDEEDLEVVRKDVSLEENLEAPTSNYATLTFYMMNGDPIRVSLKIGTGKLPVDTPAPLTDKSGSAVIEGLSYYPRAGWEMSNEQIYQQLQHKIAAGIRELARKSAEADEQVDVDADSRAAGDSGGAGGAFDSQLVVDEDQVRILKNGIEIHAYDDLIDALRDGDERVENIYADEEKTFLQVMVRSHRYVPPPEEYARIQAANAAAGMNVQPGMRDFDQHEYFRSRRNF